MLSIKDLSRRSFLAAAAAFAVAKPSFAMNQSEAEALINKVTTDIFRVINSGKSESAMFRDFEKLFAKYADVPIIARASLGVARRSASKSQLNAYTKAFQGYVSRKYGKRFREFIGAEVKVLSATKAKRGFDVRSNVRFPGRKPFVVDWKVSDASGRDKFFDLEIEGISMLRLEREEIGAMLDRRGGDLNKLIAHLKKAS